MSRARLVITAVVVEKRSVSEVVAEYGMSRSQVYALVARHRAQGEAAFEPRSRRPHTTPSAIDSATVELIVMLRKELDGAGLDAGADTIGWHLARHHQVRVSRATINPTLVRAGAITPAPAKRPKSSYLRLEAALPNQTWQSDVTHYRLKTGADAEVLTWLDDHSRYALHISAHHRVTGPVVLAAFRATVDLHGCPASTLTDNGMVFTTRFSGGRGGRNHLEYQLRAWNVVQKNSRPNHPTTCGKVERFQQTMKKWLRRQDPQPATITEVQALLDRWAQTYNTDRPHRSLPHRSTPSAVYAAHPKASPGSLGTDRSPDTHNRVRHDRIDTSGVVTLRVAGRLHHIGIGRTHTRTHVLLLVQDLHVRVINATTGELLRDLTIDPRRDYQPTGRPPGPTPKNKDGRTHNS